jgi:hypothetical protein
MEKKVNALDFESLLKSEKAKMAKLIPKPIIEEQLFNMLQVKTRLITFIGFETCFAG